VVIDDPPITSFTSNVTSGNIPFAVQFTDHTVGGNLQSWAWTFGDGSTSTQQNPVRVYSTEGIYDVSLNVTNDEGSNAVTVRNMITATDAANHRPISSFVSNVTNGTSPLTVQFNDTSLRTPTSWSWSFGDGNTSTSQNPIHTYGAVGNYTVNLTVTNAFGSSITNKTNYIIVYRIPVASFTVDNVTGIAPMRVNLTDNSLYADSVLWDFGDRQTSTDRNTFHIYNVAGTYTITLTAIGPFVNNTVTQQIIVNQPVIIPTNNTTTPTNNTTTQNSITSIIPVFGLFGILPVILIVAGLIIGFKRRDYTITFTMVGISVVIFLIIVVGLVVLSAFSGV
jgi:PKD repeat protein